MLVDIPSPALIDLHGLFVKSAVVAKDSIAVWQNIRGLQSSLQPSGTLGSFIHSLPDLAWSGLTCSWLEMQRKHCTVQLSGNSMPFTANQLKACSLRIATVEIFI